MSNMMLRWAAVGPLKILSVLMASRRGPDECWPWAGRVSRLGYGVYSHNRTSNWGAHRASYTVYVGAIPDGLVIDHLCRNRACVNPRHLEAVTPAENTRRGSTKAHCIRGHALSGDNLRTGSNGQRICRACRKTVDGRYKHLWQKRYARQRAAAIPVIKACRECGGEWEVHHGGLKFFCSKKCKHRHWARKRRERGNRCPAS